MHDAWRIVGAYNSWVEKWNRHELDRRLPLKPKSNLGCWRLCACPVSAMFWHDKLTDRELIIRVEGWRPYIKNGLFDPVLRRQASPHHLAWAGWLS